MPAAETPLKVGLVGCGGRSAGAAEQAFTAGKNARLIAMGDAIGDQLDNSFEYLKHSPVVGRVDVSEDHRYVGFDAFKKVIDEVDVDILATPPGFRPEHAACAVEKGIHAFVEKPIATDAPGVRSFLATAEAAKKKRTCPWSPASAGGTTTPDAKP